MIYMLYNYKKSIILLRYILNNVTDNLLISNIQLLIMFNSKDV